MATNPPPDVPVRTYVYTPELFDWLVRNAIWQSQALGVLMTQSDNLRSDIAELKANVARELQQVIDALAAASANNVELADLRAAVTQAHADLQTLNTNLKADDPAATP